MEAMEAVRERQNSVHTHGEILKIGVCPKCRVIYKLRSSDPPQNGEHCCRECGQPIEFYNGK